MVGKLLLVAGPSGVGKGTICRALLNRRPQIRFSVSFITRDARADEIDGVNYHFISESDFIKKRDMGEMLEYSYHNNDIWYGTPLKPIIERLNSGGSVLLEIDDNGVKQVLVKYPQAIRVFVLPPDKDALIKRLVYRSTEKHDALIARVKKMPGELIAAKEYDYLVLNDDVDTAIKDMVDIYDGEYKTPENLYKLLDELIKQSEDEVETLKLLEYYYAKAHSSDVK